MTRINCVPVQELCREHLIAEYRELPRIFALAAKACDRGDVPSNFPRTYRLGKGHVLFFYDKLRWLRKRHGELYWEMKDRGYKPTFCCDLQGLDLPDEWQCDWAPREEDLEANRARILDRLPARLRGELA